MQFYLAPMEGLTGYVYRNAYHTLFPDMDKYFTPFISPSQKRGMRTREKRDVDPQHNIDMYTVPQLMANQPEPFLAVVRILHGLGYQEINLNLGCPSPTVVTKGKGAGFLDDPRKLDRFFKEVFQHMEGEAELRNIRLSVKSRLGISFADEFPDILKVFNAHPLYEIILHPRVQEDFYKNTPDLAAFAYAMANSEHPLCYNGNLFTIRDYLSFIKEFPDTPAVMLGRGVLANPALLMGIKGGEGLTMPVLKEYHDLLYNGYQQEMNGERDVLFKMKELWFYIGALFPDAEKQLKKIKKANHSYEYEAAVFAIFSQNKICTDICF